MAYLSSEVQWDASTFDLNLPLRTRQSGFFSGPLTFGDQVLVTTINEIGYPGTYPGYDFDDAQITRYRNGARVEIGGNDLIFDNRGRLVNGSLDFYGSFDANANFRFGLFDPGISIRPLLQARATPTLSDDRQLLARVLEGDDAILLSRFSDAISARGGHDLVAGRAGNDKLSGGAAADILFGGSGADALRGDAGTDLLFGDAGDDRLIGGDGNDLLVGEEGNDTIYGGAGADRFVFIPGVGRDTVVDFGRGADRLVVTGAASIDDLTISSTQGGGTRIAYEGMVIILPDVRRGQITAADFIFSPSADTVLNGPATAFFDNWDYATVV